MKKIMVLLTIMIVCLMFIVNASTKTIVTDDLVSYWTFDQGTIIGRKVKDVWGENDATLVGSPKKRVEGYVKSGIELDGKGDYVSLPNVGNFGSKIGEYTFEVWLKTTNKKKWSAIYRVIENTCAMWNNGTGILINATTGFNGFNEDILTEQDWIMIERSRIRENSCGRSASGRKFSISDGEWHQIVYTTRRATGDEVDQINQNRPRQHAVGHCLRIVTYIDSKIIANPLSCSNRENLIAYVEPTFLGAVNNEGKASGFFEGIFDEVRIYDRALTHEEVMRNYESGIGLGVEAAEKLSTVWGALKEKR